MKIDFKISFWREKCLTVITASLLMFALHLPSKGQEPPPRPVTITVTAQQLAFGAFYQGPLGGTVTINPDGSRVSSGDIVLLMLGYSFSTALYEVVGNPGTVVSILNGPDVLLPGSNGGSLTLTIGDSDPASPFVITTIPPTPAMLNIGGTITAGNPASNPPGSYSGTFDITFIQE